MNTKIINLLQWLNSKPFYFSPVKRLIFIFFLTAFQNKFQSMRPSVFKSGEVFVYVKKLEFDWLTSFICCLSKYKHQVKSAS